MILIRYRQSNVHSTTSTKSSVVAFQNVSPHNKAHGEEFSTHFDTHAVECGSWYT
jgi:hypothetical protein